MARKVFFSFHYGRDLWRANVVGNSAMVEGVSVAGFEDEVDTVGGDKRGEDLRP